MFLDWIIVLEFAVFLEDHDHHGYELFGDRGEVEGGGGFEGLVGLDIGCAKGFFVEWGSVFGV